MIVFANKIGKFHFLEKSAPGEIDQADARKDEEQGDFGKRQPSAGVEQRGQAEQSHEFEPKKRAGHIAYIRAVAGPVQPAGRLSCKRHISLIIMFSTDFCKKTSLFAQPVEILWKQYKPSSMRVYPHLSFG
jgi:hypothetical protein